MSKIGIIISREYMSRVRKKSFILTTILVPILFAAMITVPALITAYSSDNDIKTVAVLDKSGIIKENLEDSKSLKFEFVENEIASLKNDLKDSKYYAILEISELDTLYKPYNVSLHSTEQIKLQEIENIENSITNVLKGYQLEQYNIPDNIMQNIQSQVSIKTYRISEDNENNEKKETTVVAYMGIGYVSSFIIYMFIFMFGGMVMRGVIEEKNNRIIEVIVSSVKPLELMIGKIIGVALVALTQFFIWICLIMLIVFGVSSFTGKSNVEIAQSAVQTNINSMNVDLIEGNTNTLDITNIQNTVDGEEDSDFLDTLLNTIKSMNIFGIISTFIIYFILGYLLYSSMFAAVGASVDNEADTQQLMLPITLPLIIGLFIMLNAFQNPNSTVAIWGSIIPFTSPMVMVARFAYGVPTWQYILSIALLLGTFFLMAWISAKIYRIGILSYGKKANWKDIIKWIKFKD